MASPQSLCDQCFTCVQLLDTNRDALDAGEGEVYEQVESGLDHHLSLASFETALHRPCLICNYLNTLWSPYPELASFSTTWRLLTFGDEAVLLHFCLQGREEVLVQLSVIDNEQAIARNNDALVAPSTSDDSVLQKVRSWLEYCEANHPMCARQHSDTVRLPSRLVDLFPEDQPSGAYWRLIDDTRNVIGSYASLSHRWGRGNLEPFKLTKGSIDAMRNGLPDECLSGTYRDAMRVARNIGLRYIWIDSLCVVQDADRLNIQVEAHRMADVYGNSSCNIAALTARQDGIFSPRDPQLNSSSATILPADRYGLLNSYVILLSKLVEQSVLETPLSRRGWILQEQTLPSRVLYFGQDQVLWSCLEGAFCELYPLDDFTLDWLDSGLYEGDFGSLREYLGHASRQTAAARSGSSRPNIDLMDLLGVYGQRDLTFAGDKLLAISGITQLLGTLWNDTIIGGLIESQLPADLLWVIDHITAQQNGIEVVQSPVQRAPSWSWAYYDGPITRYQGPYWLKLGKEIARVIEIDTQVTQIEDIRIVTGGDLVLQGGWLPLVPDSSVQDQSDTQSTAQPVTLWKMLFVQSLQYAQQGNVHASGLKLTTDMSLDYGPHSLEDNLDGRVLFDLPEYQALQEPLVAVFVTGVVSSVTGTEAQERKVYRFNGLVLRQHAIRGEGVYERIGTFMVVVYGLKGTLPDTPMTKDWKFIDFGHLRSKKLKLEEHHPDLNRPFMRTFRIA